MGRRTIVLAITGLTLLTGLLLYGQGTDQTETEPPGNFSLTAQPDQEALHPDLGEEVTFTIICKSGDGPAWFETGWQHLQRDPFDEDTSDARESRSTHHTDTFTIMFDEPGHHLVHAFCNHIGSGWSDFTAWTVNVG